MTEGVTESDQDVVTEEKLSETDSDTDGRLMTVPLSDAVLLKLTLPVMFALTLALAAPFVSAGLFPTSGDSKVKMLNPKEFKKVMKEGVRWMCSVCGSRYADASRSTQA